MAPSRRRLWLSMNLAGQLRTFELRGDVYLTHEGKT